MKKLRLIVCLGFILINILGCQKDDNSPQHITAPINAKIKRILMYPGVNTSTPEYIDSEYEYDSLGRIIKVTHPMYQDGMLTGTGEYELYKYNSDGLIQEISNYNYNANPGTGFVNIWTRVFSYSTDGQVTRMSTQYNGSPSSEYSLYHYKDGRLIKTENYTFSDVFQSYILDKYNKSGQVIKESYYSFDNQPLYYIAHTYSDGLNMLSDTYSINKEVVHLREITRTYDNNRNLETFMSRELVPWSSAMSYKLKYEYY